MRYYVSSSNVGVVLGNWGFFWVNKLYTILFESGYKLRTPEVIIRIFHKIEPKQINWGEAQCQEHEPNGRIPFN